MSAASAKSADPSMEEILASIRRIIADDDDKSPDPGGRPEMRRAEPPQQAANQRDRDWERHEDHESEVEEVLDLATVKDSGRDEAVSVAVPDVAAPDVEKRPDTSLEIELPDLSFQVAPKPEPSPVDGTPSGEKTPAAAAAQETAPEPVGLSKPEPSPEPVVAAPPPSPEAILSHQATASVGQAFNLLSHTIMSQNTHTLEDIVREMLKPMLKSWLDDNLPPLVERLVAAEIQRVARGQR
jgi:cell pole-organizing protein PopZ